MLVRTATWGGQGRGVCSSPLSLAEGHPPGVESPAGVSGGLRVVEPVPTLDVGSWLQERGGEVGVGRGGAPGSCL